MFTFVSITYKVLSVMNIAVEKDNATSKYFLGSCILTMKYILKWENAGKELIIDDFKGKIQLRDPT